MEEIEKLKKEIERLQKINEIKSDLISISAHQLRTTLSAMKWILKMFLDKDFGPLSGEQEGFLQKAYESSERMVKLVNEMLTLNHTEDTEVSYDIQNEDIISLIESVIFDFTGESNKLGIEIIFPKLNTPLSKVMMDKEKIRVVLQNLIENAIKYSNKGDKVFISARSKDSMIEVSVKDMGIGIKEEDKNKIFSKFYRTQNAQEKDSVGSGLGLYTIKNIVENHGGKISFTSTEGEGSTFSFTIPHGN